MRVRRNQAGAVTAEVAVVLPVLVVVAAALAWLVALGVSQVRVVDAARETARAMARGDSAEVSEKFGRAIAPGGSHFTIVREGDQVRVEVSAQVSGPGGLFRLPGFLAHSTAVARVEP